MIMKRMFVIWSFSRSNNGTRMPCRMGSARVGAPVWTVSGMGHWKRLIKIPGDTDCYYRINNMTCSIYVYYYPFILVILPDILPTCILWTSCGDTLLMYPYTLYSIYFLLTHCFCIITNTIAWLLMSISCVYVYIYHHYTV